jgi:hypothetical protein
MALGIFLLAPSQGQAITAFQINDFQSGTTESWTNGPSSDPSWIANGGPNGVGDGFLQIGSNGTGGSGGIPASFNLDQWSGDYDAADITFIEFDLRLMELANGHSNLEIRLVLIGQNTDNRWTSTEAFVLPEDDQWYHVSFALSEAEMTWVLGDLSFDELFSDVGRLMIRHDEGTPSHKGTQIAALVGVDNIRAIPEPSTALLLALGLAGLARRDR